MLLQVAIASAQFAEQSAICNMKSESVERRIGGWRSTDVELTWGHCHKAGFAQYGKAPTVHVNVVGRAVHTSVRQELSWTLDRRCVVWLGWRYLTESHSGHVLLPCVTAQALVPDMHDADSTKGEAHNMVAAAVSFLPNSGAVSPPPHQRSPTASAPGTPAAQPFKMALRRWSCGRERKGKSAAGNDPC